MSLESPVPFPPAPHSFQLPSIPLVDLSSQAPPKDWPHAPGHRLADAAVYFLTAGTLHKRHCFDSPEKRDLLEGLLLATAREHGWQLEAWAVFANHYHFVARGYPTSANLGRLVHRLHGASSRALNLLEGTPGRQVWHNYWDTRLTHQHCYMARLNYVHLNAVKHGLVTVANQYAWCSAAWFERVASPAQVQTIYRFKIDQVNVEDDY